MKQESANHIVSTNKFTLRSESESHIKHKENLKRLIYNMNIERKFNYLRSISHDMHRLGINYLVRSSL